MDQQTAQARSLTRPAADSPASAPAAARRGLPGPVYVVASLAGGVGLWWLGAAVDHSVLLPSPGAVARLGWHDLATGYLERQAWASLERVLVGYLLGVAAAIPTGFLMGWYRWARRALEPWVQFFRTIPPLALIPLVIVALGIGQAPKVFLIFLAAFLVTVIAIYQGVRGLDPTFVNAARVLGAREWNIFAHVAVPATVPYLLVGMRIALGGAWATVVAAELINTNNGLGAMMENAGQNLDMPTVILGVVTIGVLGIVMDRAVVLLELRLARWQDRQED